MPHSSDPKLIVPFATEGDPLRQTEEEKKKFWVITSVVLFYGVGISVAMDYVSLMEERADPRLSRRELEC